MVSGASEANILRDPKEHREAVLGDFVHDDHIRTFGLDQAALRIREPLQATVLHQKG
jgi:hypothetical protein